MSLTHFPVEAFTTHLGCHWIISRRLLKTYAGLSWYKKDCQLLLLHITLTETFVLIFLHLTVTRSSISRWHTVLTEFVPILQYLPVSSCLPQYFCVNIGNTNTSNCVCNKKRLQVTMLALWFAVIKEAQTARLTQWTESLYSSCNSAAAVRDLSGLVSVS